MKKLLYGLVVILALVVIAYGANRNTPSAKIGTGDSIQLNHSMAEEISSGIETVLIVLKEFKAVTEQSPDDTTAIQTSGKDVEANWDKIEKRVEKMDPVAYEDIERSLYPLIAEAGKDQPNVVMVQQLIDETMEKLTEFKEEMGA